jgi:hypothetical protein
MSWEDSARPSLVGEVSAGDVTRSDHTRIAIQADEVTCQTAIDGRGRVLPPSREQSYIRALLPTKCMATGFMIICLKYTEGRSLFNFCLA